MLKLIHRPEGLPARAKGLSAGGPDELAPLARSCRQGEPGAAKTLLVTVGPAMLQMVRRVLGPKDADAEDVLQEALLAFIHAVPAFRGESTVKHFACRIATLTALKVLRARPRDPMHIAVLDEDCWDGVAPDHWAQASNRRQALRALLDDLPEAQAEALVLHFVAGHSVEEMAQTAKIPAETIRSRLRLAKETLRARIAQDPSMADVLEETP
jgi:RNA polymerase sigma-70 factor (ECF subfamily)